MHFWVASRFLFWASWALFQRNTLYLADHKMAPNLRLLPPSIIQLVMGKELQLRKDHFTLPSEEVIELVDHGDRSDRKKVAGLVKSKKKDTFGVKPVPMSLTMDSWWHCLCK